MAEYSKKKWTRFGIEKSTCRSLTRVFHVAHVRAALDVLRDGKVASQLSVGSRLKKKGIRVVWLSPNKWKKAGGFVYGNVAFEIDWPTLIQGMRFYWVGALDGTRIPTCRILITDRDRDGELLPYDPTEGDGPWWFDGHQHYRNRSCCLQFMLEADVPLDRVSLRFVKHHAYRCKDHSECCDKGHKSRRGGARFLAGACTHGLLGLHPRFWVKENKTPRKALGRAWSELQSVVTRKVATWRGTITATDPEAVPLVREVLAAVSDWRRKDCRDRVARFRSAEDAVEACARLIESDLGLLAGTLSRSDYSA